MNVLRLVPILLFLATVQGAGTRKLLIAPICEQGYDIGGDCLSEEGVYVEKLGKELSFKQNDEWSGDIVIDIFGKIFDAVFPFDAINCVGSVVGGSQDLLGDCACPNACSKASAKITLSPAGFLKGLISFFAGNECESVCGKLYKKAGDIDAEASNSDSNNASRGAITLLNIFLATWPVAYLLI